MVATAIPAYAVDLTITCRCVIGGVNSAGAEWITKSVIPAFTDKMKADGKDVKVTLNQFAGVRDSAVVGVANGAEERVHAVLALEPGGNANDIVRQANAVLSDHQRIRGVSVWTDGDLNAIPPGLRSVAADAAVQPPFVLRDRRGESSVNVGWAILHPRPSFAVRSPH